MISNKLARFFIIFFLLNSYLVYVYYFWYEYLILIKKEIKKSFIYIGFFNLIFFLVTWLFFMVNFKPHSSVNKQFSLNKKILKKLNLKLREQNEEFRLTCEQNLLLIDYIQGMNLQVSTRNSFGQVNVCFKCKIIRPDRCYHCSKCSICILKRDHHCPLLNKCIGFSNQKYFILLLIYTLIYSIFFTSTIINSMSFKEFFSLYEKIHLYPSFNFVLTFFLIFISTILCFFLLVNSIYLACINKTSIENNHPPRLEIKSYESLNTDNIFDLGTLENLKQLFGSSILLSVLPIWTSEGNGHHFKVFNNII